WLETDGCESDSSRAARENERCRATARNVSTRRGSIASSYQPLRIIIGSYGAERSQWGDMEASTQTIPQVRLNDGHDIPQLGFGVFQIPPGATAEAVALALEAGYRHIDTAEMYGNEAEVGEAVRAADLDRSEVFVTSKLSNRFHRPDDARAAF